MFSKLRPLKESLEALPPRTISSANTLPKLTLEKVSAKKPATAPAAPPSLPPTWISPAFTLSKLTLSKLVWLGVRVITRILKSNPHSAFAYRHYKARRRTAAVTAGTTLNIFLSQPEIWTGGNHGS